MNDKYGVRLHVSGMDCANCANSITKVLEKKGLKGVFVNFQTDEVFYEPNDTLATAQEIKSTIEKLGYKVEDNTSSESGFQTKILISALFTAPLILNHFLMILGISISQLEIGWVQLLLTIPPFIIGFSYFGKSALGSVLNGSTNMDVLIFIGSTAAFFYSLLGLVLNEPSYLFFETTSSIITLVLLGNWIEKRAVKGTTSAIETLSNLQPVKANCLLPSGTIITVKVEELKIGDILMVNEGDKVPIDGVIIEGIGSFDESIITGESIPVDKGIEMDIVGGSLLMSGNIKMKVTHVGKDTFLNQIIELVKRAQEEKPSIQKIADRISSIFVPAVLIIAAVSFLGNYWLLDQTLKDSIMNSIAVLVISCPCAMGLATPTAIMVGVGRLAKNGILVKGGQTIELFANVKNIVFDKTGTLTTGDFGIDSIQYYTKDENYVNQLIFEIEKYSSHPIAKFLVNHFGNKVTSPLKLPLDVREKSGFGLIAHQSDNTVFKIGSKKFVGVNEGQLREFTIFLSKNDELLAAVQLKDQLKPDIIQTVNQLKKKGLNPIILSGDQEDKVKQVSNLTKINTYYYEKKPNEKVQIIKTLSDENPTAMVGDGINDAAAIAAATVGISMGEASSSAIDSAKMVLLNGNLERLNKAYNISKETLKTIKQNLFWAFSYNLVAIPIAAFGYLNPMWGAAFMAFSDLIVIGNSVRLKHKKIK